ncbi:MAG: MFS transporter, partial [candidate division WOR-3 bacterium]
SGYIIQLFTNAALVSTSIFVPLMAEGFTSNRFIIGLVVSSYNGAIFLSSTLFGRLSDIRGRKYFVNIGLALCAPTFILHLFIKGLRSLFLIRILAGFTAGMYPAALTTLVFESNYLFGLFTAAGSLGWGLGSFVSGLIGQYQILFLQSALLFAIAFAFSLKMVENEERRLNPPPIFPVKIIRKNLKIYLAFFLRHAGAMGIWAIYPLFLSKLGADKFWIGLIYTINPVSQFFFMLIFDKHKSTGLVPTGLLFSAFTFFLFGIVRDYKTFAIIQLVLALSWATLYLGSLKYLLERNVERATAVGIFNSVSGLCGIIGPILGGFLSLFNFETLMFTASLLSITGWVIFKFLHQTPS